MAAPPGPSRTVRVLLADDQRLFAEGVMSLLAADERLEVVGHALDGVEAVDLTESLRPDLVLMDIAMPNMDGIEATRAIKKARPETAVLILTAAGDEDLVARATDAGASGYLTKDAASSDLVATIVEIAALAIAFSGARSANASQ